MKCAGIERLIEAFVDDRLPRRLAGRVAAHITECERCRTRVEEARRVVRALRSSEPARAPQGFSGRVMELVYRDELSSARRGAAAPDPRRVYRRLGYSFVATAAVLSASLLVPRLAYPNLIRPETLAAQLGVGRPAAVARVINDAGLGFRQVIGSDSQDTAER